MKVNQAYTKLDAVDVCVANPVGVCDLQLYLIPFLLIDFPYLLKLGKVSSIIWVTCQNSQII